MAITAQARTSSAPAAPAGPPRGRPADTSFTTHVSWVGRVAVVHGDGVLDAAAAPVLDREVRTAFENRPHALVLDLAGVSQLDAPGLRALLAIERRARGRGCPFAVSDVPPAVDDFLRRLCADRALPRHESVPEAVRALVTPSWRG